MGTITRTGSVTLEPIGYEDATQLTANTSYPYTNGYHDTTNTSRYAVIQANANNRDGYIYYTFDTSDIPSDATITSITAKARGRFSNSSGVTGSFQLYADTTAKGSATTISGTTSTIYDLTEGSSWTLSEAQNIRLRINTRRTSNSRNIRFYGAEITIEYSWQETTWDINSSVNQDAVVVPASASVEEGDVFELQIIPNDHTTAPTLVTDNDVDVTSLITTRTSDTGTTIISNYTDNSNFTLTNVSDAYNDSNNTNDYATLDVSGRKTGSIYFTFTSLNIPSSATILSCTAKVAIRFSRNGSSSGVNATCQMAHGTTAKGTEWEIVSSATDVARTVHSFAMDDWSVAEINDARIHIQCTNNASSTHRYLYVYGGDLEVAYDFGGTIYVYTISSVHENHNIVVEYSGGGGSDKSIYVKIGGTWIRSDRMFVKVGGTWQDTSGIKIKLGGNWL